MEQPRPTRNPSQSLPTTNHNSPTHTSQAVPLLNLAIAQKQYALVKSKSMPGTSRELPAPTKFTFSSHDVSTMSKMTDNTSQIPHWREFPKPPIRILCRVELKAKLKLDTYKSTSHLQEYHHKSSYPSKPVSVFEPSPEQQYIQQYYEYDSHDESEEEWESSDEEEEEDEEDAENYGYTYHAPIQPQQQQPSSKHFTFPMQQPQQPSHQQYIPRSQYDYQKSTVMRPQQQPYQQPQPQQSSQQQRLSIQHMEEKKRMIQRSSMKSVPMKQVPIQQSQQSSNNQVVFTIHPQQHKYSQPDMKRASFSQPSQQPPQHQRSSSAHQMEIRRHRSAPSIASQTPPKHIAYQQPQQQQQQPQTNAYDVARNLWRKQRRSYQDMLSTLQTKLHVSGSYPPQFVSP